MLVLRLIDEDTYLSIGEVEIADNEIIYGIIKNISLYLMCVG